MQLMCSSQLRLILHLSLENMNKSSHQLVIHSKGICVLQSNIVGIFATHQHDMVDDRLRFLEEMQRAYCCHMEVVEGAGKDTAGMPSWLPWYRPTFRMQPGGNYDSLALQVAWQEVGFCTLVPVE